MSEHSTSSRPLKSILKKVSQFGPAPDPVPLSPPRKRRRRLSPSVPEYAVRAMRRKRKRAFTMEDVVFLSDDGETTTTTTTSTSSFSSRSSSSNRARPKPLTGRSPRKRRRFNIYEAVAGRISTAGRMATLDELAAHRRRANAHGVRIERGLPQLMRFGVVEMRSPEEELASRGERKQGGPAARLGLQQASTRDRTTRSTKSLPASEVLLKAKRAPDRFAEPSLDVWGHHRWLEGRTARIEDEGVGEAWPAAEKLRDLRWTHKIRNGLGSAQKTGLGLEGRGKEYGLSLAGGPSEARDNQRRNQSLPESEFLKVLHAYVAHFYFRNTGSRGDESSYQGKESNRVLNWKSLDGTALIALGILLEETAKQAVQADGGRSFVEGLDQDGLRAAKDTESVITKDWARIRGAAKRKAQNEERRRAQAEAAAVAAAEAAAAAVASPSPPNTRDASVESEDQDQAKALSIEESDTEIVKSETSSNSADEEFTSAKEESKDQDSSDEDSSPRERSLSDSGSDRSRASEAVRRSHSISNKPTTASSPQRRPHALARRSRSTGADPEVRRESDTGSSSSKASSSSFPIRSRYSSVLEISDSEEEREAARRRKSVRRSIVSSSPAAEDQEQSGGSSEAREVRPATFRPQLYSTRAAKVEAVSSEEHSGGEGDEEESADDQEDSEDGEGMEQEDDSEEEEESQAEDDDERSKREDGFDYRASQVAQYGDDW